MADSIDASLIEMTWAVLCTSKRSMTSIATIAPMSVAHAHNGTSKLAKLSLAEPSAARRRGRITLDTAPTIPVTTNPTPHGGRRGAPPSRPARGQGDATGRGPWRAEHEPGAQNPRAMLAKRV
jgi:hypothetical protein